VKVSIVKQIISSQNIYFSLLAVSSWFSSLLVFIFCSMLWMETKN